MKGKISYKWAYEFNYSPFISDFDLSTLQLVKFEKGEPLSIFNYLLMILNRSNAQILPLSYQSLVYSEESEIVDLYPLEYVFE
jgi:5'-3' exonuclease